MIIETLAWGNLEVQEEQLYHFSKGIPGFEDENDFVLIAMEGTPFWVLQSLDNKSLSFLLGDPFAFYPDYEFELPSDEAEELEIVSQVIVRCMITFKEQAEQSTINLLAPIVLNPERLLGKQVVLHKTPYHTKHSLFQEQQPVIDGKDGG